MSEQADSGKGPEYFSSVSEQVLRRDKSVHIKSVLGMIAVEKPHPKAVEAMDFLREHIGLKAENSERFSDEQIKSEAITLYAQLVLECAVKGYKCYVVDAYDYAQARWDSAVRYALNGAEVPKGMVTASNDASIHWPGLDVYLPEAVTVYSRNAKDDPGKSAKRSLRNYFDLAYGGLPYVSDQYIEDLSVTLYATMVQKCRIEGKSCIIIASEGNSEQDRYGAREIIWPGLEKPFPDDDESEDGWDDDDGPNDEPSLDPVMPRSGVKIS